MKTKIKLLNLTAVLINGCGKEKSTTDNKVADFKAFRTTTVIPQNITNSINLTGRIVPLQKVDIIAEVQGTARLTRKVFKEGASFKKGELLLSLEDNKFRYNLNAQRSKFLSTMVNVISDVQLDYPEEFPIWNDFLHQIDVSKNLPELPEASNQQLKYFLNGRNLYNLYYNIKSQEETLRDYRIYAPFSGSVTMSSINAGDLIRPGVKLGEFIRTDTYEVKSAVTARDINRFKVGQEVAFYLSNIDQTVQGTVKRIGKTLDANTQSVNVYFEVPGKDLKEGMYVEANFPIGVFKEAVSIDNNLITRKQQVHIIEDSTVVAKTIKVLNAKEKQSIVTGLKPGDVLITEEVNAPAIGARAIPKA